LSTNDNDQSLIKLDKFIITKLLYVNVRCDNKSINILERVNYTPLSSKILELHSPLSYVKIYTPLPSYSKYIRKYFTPLP